MQTCCGLQKPPCAAPRGGHRWPCPALDMVISLPRVPTGAQRTRCHRSPRSKGVRVPGGWWESLFWDFSGRKQEGKFRGSWKKRHRNSSVRPVNVSVPCRWQGGVQKSRSWPRHASPARSEHPSRRGFFFFFGVLSALFARKPQAESRLHRLPGSGWRGWMQLQSNPCCVSQVPRRCPAPLFSPNSAPSKPSSGAWPPGMGWGGHWGVMGTRGLLSPPLSAPSSVQAALARCCHLSPHSTCGGGFVGTPGWQHPPGSPGAGRALLESGQLCAAVRWPLGKTLGVAVAFFFFLTCNYF